MFALRIFLRSPCRLYVRALYCSFRLIEVFALLLLVALVLQEKSNLLFSLPR